MTKRLFFDRICDTCVPSDEFRFRCRTSRSQTRFSPQAGVSSQTASAIVGAARLRSPAVSPSSVSDGNTGLNAQPHFSQGHGALGEICLSEKLSEGNGEICGSVKLSPLRRRLNANPFTYRGAEAGGGDSLLIRTYSCIQISPTNVNHVLHAERRPTEVVGSGILSAMRSSRLCRSEWQRHVLFRAPLAAAGQNKTAQSSDSQGLTKPRPQGCQKTNWTSSGVLFWRENQETPGRIWTSPPPLPRRSWALTSGWIFRSATSILRSTSLTSAA